MANEPTRDERIKAEASKLETWLKENELRPGETAKVFVVIKEDRVKTIIGSRSRTASELGKYKRPKESKERMTALDWRTISTYPWDPKLRNIVDLFAMKGMCLLSEAGAELIDTDRINSEFRKRNAPYRLFKFKGDAYKRSQRPGRYNIVKVILT